MSLAVCGANPCAPKKFEWLFNVLPQWSHVPYLAHGATVTSSPGCTSAACQGRHTYTSPRLSMRGLQRHIRSVELVTALLTIHLSHAC